MMRKKMKAGGVVRVVSVLIILEKIYARRIL